MASSKIVLVIDVHSEQLKPLLDIALKFVTVIHFVYLLSLHEVQDGQGLHGYTFDTNPRNKSWGVQHQKLDENAITLYFDNY